LHYLLIESHKEEHEDHLIESHKEKHEDHLIESHKEKHEDHLIESHDEEHEEKHEESCHDPSLARLSLLALPDLPSLRHLD